MAGMDFDKSSALPIGSHAGKDPLPLTVKDFGGTRDPFRIGSIGIRDFDHDAGAGDPATDGRPLVKLRTHTLLHRINKTEIGGVDRKPGFHAACKAGLGRKLGDIGKPLPARKCANTGFIDPAFDKRVHDLPLGSGAQAGAKISEIVLVGT
ncbi:MAG: hypothetical protein R3D52_10955 [Xanthobacteraceae bacterium]